MKYKILTVLILLIGMMMTGCVDEDDTGASEVVEDNVYEALSESQMELVDSFTMICPNCSIPKSGIKSIYEDEETLVILYNKTHFNDITDSNKSYYTILRQTLYKDLNGDLKAWKINNRHISRTEYGSECAHITTGDLEGAKMSITRYSISEDDEWW